MLMKALRSAYTPNAPSPQSDVDTHLIVTVAKRQNLLTYRLSDNSVLSRHYQKLDTELPAVLPCGDLPGECRGSKAGI